MRLLVTGAAGFMGRHLVRRLRAERPDAEIVGLEIREPAEPVAGLTELRLADVADERALASALSGAFDTVAHLAALLPPAFGTDMLRVNVGGTANLLAALGRSAGKFVLVSSSAVYGYPAVEGPIGEDTPLAPVSPYGESFVAREMAARLLCREPRLELVIVRPFNLVGPGQRATMMIPSFAERLARIEAGLQPPRMQVGRLDTARDYLDVRDAADGIAAALLAGVVPPVINLASGRAHRGQDVLDRLLALARLRPEMEQIVDPSRASDPAVLVGDPALARRALGWSTRVPFDMTLRETLDDWRERVRG